jgi:putative endonuclease
MPRKFTSINQKKGKIGEKIAEKYLINKGFRIIETNYTISIGEIDIIAIKNNIIHFIEVKSVTREISLFNSSINLYNPAENFHRKKLERVYKTANTYCITNNVHDQWRIDLLCVYIDHKVKKAKVDMISVY